MSTLADTTASLRASYDEVPYRSLPLRQTHPDHLAMVASLFGFAATRIERCRVLEIGCSAGGNLIPMAACYLESEFVGIDLSPVQVAAGAADVKALGLTNVRLRAMNLMDFDTSFGEFDYIIAHGIYSWVPAAVQERILEVCARQLTASGIAIVSYNALPGWRMLAVVRDAMRYRTRDIVDPKARVAEARATLAMLSESVQGDDSAYAKVLRMAAENLRQKPDYYVLHEYLEATNEALYFHEFMERAERHALRYLAEADVKLMLSTGLSPATSQALNRIAIDLKGREQFLDFLRNRSFRQTLLIGDGPPLDRKVSPERVKGSWISARLRSPNSFADLGSDKLALFSLADGRGLEVRNPITKAAFTLLGERWPLAIPFGELYAEARKRLGKLGTDQVNTPELLASEIMRCFIGDAVELHSCASPFVLSATERPEACPLARLQASRETVVTNRRHEIVPLDEEMLTLLPLLDGEHTQAEIARLGWPDRNAADREARLADALARIGQGALLVHSSPSDTQE